MLHVHSAYSACYSARAKGLTSSEYDVIHVEGHGSHSELVDMSSREEGTSSEVNPHSVSSILVSTPRSSKSKRNRKLKLQAQSQETSASGGAEDCVLSQFLNVLDSISDVKYRILSPKGLENGTLEVTPATSNVSALGPVDVVRLLVSETSGLYQVQVMFPIPRNVDRLKGMSTCHFCFRWLSFAL